MKKILLLLILTALAAAGCKKSDAPDDVNDPVFSVQFDIDSLRTITAGLSGVYLFTGYQRIDNEIVSTSSFSQENCPGGDCPGSLTFEFRYFVEYDTVFYPGIYGFTYDSVPISNLLRTRFTWKENPEYELATLALEDPVFASFDTPARETEILLPDVPQVVRLTAFDTLGYVSEVRRTILPSDSLAFPQVSIYGQGFGSYYKLTATATGPAAIASIKWSNGATGAVSFTDSLALQDEYRVTVTDEFGKTAEAAFINLGWLVLPEIRTANFKYTGTPAFQPAGFGNVTIQWVDAQGRKWRSDGGAQTADAYFIVLQNEPYEPNEKGDTTRKLEVQFLARLYDDQGEFLPVSGQGTVAMAKR